MCVLLMCVANMAIVMAIIVCNEEITVLCGSIIIIIINV